MTRKAAFAAPGKYVAFDGERCTPWVTTQIHAAHMHRYLAAVDMCQGKRVLDIACGFGYGAAMLIRNGAAEVVGADIDAASIANAAETYAHPGLSFVTTDITRPLPFEEASFDVILCYETIEHIAEQSGFLGELKRVLTSDGVLVISTPDKRKANPEPNPFHVKELTEAEFLALVQGQFAHVALSYQGFLCGSVMTGAKDTSEGWQRAGFLDYQDDGGAAQRHYIIATACNAAPAQLPLGTLHDGAIVSTLNKRIRELEAELADLQKADTL